MDDKKDKYRPKIGEKYELDMKLIRERTRSIIAIAILVAGFLALMISWGYSVVHNDYDALTIAILIVSPFFFLILKWYFWRG